MLDARLEHLDRSKASGEEHEAVHTAVFECAKLGKRMESRLDSFEKLLGYPLDKAGATVRSQLEHLESLVQDADRFHTQEQSRISKEMQAVPANLNKRMEALEKMQGQYEFNFSKDLSASTSKVNNLSNALKKAMEDMRGFVTESDGRLGKEIQSA